MKPLEYEIPVVALRGMTILPGMAIHFDISRNKSIHAIERAMGTNGMVMLVSQVDTEVSEPGFEDVYHVGTVAEVKQIVKLPNKIIRVMAEGKYKAELLEFTENSKYLSGLITHVYDNDEMPDELMAKAMTENIHDLVKIYASVDLRTGREVLKRLLTITDIKELLDTFAGNFPMEYTVLQSYLECGSILEKYNLLVKYLADAIEIAQIKAELAGKVKAQVEKNQKEFVMREQLKIIKDELGEGDSESEVEEFLRKTEELDADDEIKQKLKKEITRYKTTSSGSAEASVSRGYIETLLEMPWNKMSEDNLDIANAKKVLDEDHYGLTKVKERILEFLSVRVLTGKGEAPILCFVGPPGTGKTSIAKSVARALNREYVRICLGGVRDEAEIRGHRKTYVGAMPGRIAEGLRQAGVKNPLMLLDEIDKVSGDRYKGDTEAALLEVLDGAQNSRFRDHYIEVPLDLSEVLFIATANDLSNISKPLRDRMEIIEISSYTANEKFHIAKQYLLPKQIAVNGLKKGNLSVTDKAIEKIIEDYTREAGVRNLERQFGTICRKTAKKIVLGEGKKVSISERNLKDYLGKEKFHKDRIENHDQVGVVRGLAWTSVGGDTLSIEVNVMPGKGKLNLTGQLGDVMQESARAAYSYVRSVAEKYDVMPEFFEKNDIHVHIPEGAVPKDGPSAGITMATAILSAVTGKKVRSDVAMTGEVTIRGRVLAIGGLKEKLLAAKMAGVKQVLVPGENRADVAELEKEITDGLQIIFVDSMNDVIKNAFAERR
ncbi:MAG: endopeptidase La [Thermoflexaceae bacterium]|nr:endopeptidase La [Thermoflexaceae bacterium]